MPNSRRVGHNYERELVKKFKAIGFEGCCTSRNESKKRDDEGVDLCFTGPLNVQAKRMKNQPNFRKVLDAMPDEPGQINVVFHKVPNKGEIVVMREGDFMECLAAAVKEGLVKP